MFFISVPIHILIVEAQEACGDIGAGLSILNSLLNLFQLSVTEVEGREGSMQNEAASSTGDDVTTTSSSSSTSKKTTTQLQTSENSTTSVENEAVLKRLAVAPFITSAVLKRDHCMAFKYAIRFARRTQVSGPLFHSRAYL